MDKELQNLSNATATASEKFMTFLQDSMPYIILLVSVAFTIVKSLFTFGLSNPFSAEFWIDLGTNCATTLATYSAFCVHGNKEFKITNIPYQNNLKAWGEYSAKIRKECPTEFLQFCRDYAKECGLAKRRREFERRSLIPWEVFEAQFLPLSDLQLKDKYLSGEITKSDYRAIYNARRPCRTPQINATSILCGSDSVPVEKIASANRNYIAQSIALRPLTMLLVSAGLAIISPVFSGISSADVIFSIVSSAFMIVAAAVSGNTAGNTGARREAADIKAKIYFLDTFSEKFEKSVDKSKES